MHIIYLYFTYFALRRKCRHCARATTIEPSTSCRRSVTSSLYCHFAPSLKVSSLSRLTVAAFHASFRLMLPLLRLSHASSPNRNILSVSRSYLSHFSLCFCCALSSVKSVVHFLGLLVRLFMLFFTAGLFKKLWMT